MGRLYSMWSVSVEVLGVRGETRCSCCQNAKGPVIWMSVKDLPSVYSVCSAIHRFQMGQILTSMIVRAPFSMPLLRSMIRTSSQGGESLWNADSFLCQSKTSFDEKGNSEQNSKIFLVIGCLPSWNLEVNA